MLESVRSSLNDASTKKDELSDENDSLQQQIVSLQSNLVEVAASNEAEMENLQEVLERAQSSLNCASMKKDELSDENGSLYEQIVSLQSKLAEVTASNEAKIENLQEVLERAQSSLSDISIKKG